MGDPADEEQDAPTGAAAEKKKISFKELLLGNLALALGFAGGVVLFAGVLVGVSLFSQQPKKEPEPEPPPLVLKLTTFPVPQMVVRSTSGGASVMAAMQVEINLPTTGSMLILRSNQPYLLERIQASLEQNLAAYRASDAAVQKVASAITDIANDIIRSVRCADLPAATQAEGCSNGSELPVVETVVRKLVFY